MLYKLKVQDLKETVPTIGLNVETGSYNNFEIIAWDSGGRMKVIKTLMTTISFI